MESEIAALRQSNLELREQLALIRQKASLYYITSSELDAVRRSNIASPLPGAVRVDAGTLTDFCGDELYCSRSEPYTTSETQTNVSSDVISTEQEVALLKAEIEILKSVNSLNEKTERKRIEFMKTLKCSADTKSLVDQYADLYKEYLRSTQLFVNHSMEVRKRDAMVESLLEKIKLLECCFTAKLSRTEEIALSRKEVIRELGDQVRLAMSQRHSSEHNEMSQDWTTIAAMHAEMEDLKAELSRAKTNWAATKDELLRLRFASDALAPRSIVDNDDDNRSTNIFPSPLIAILDSGASPACVTPSTMSVLRAFGKSSDPR